VSNWTPNPTLSRSISRDLRELPPVCGTCHRRWPDQCECVRVDPIERPGYTEPGWTVDVG